MRRQPERHEQRAIIQILSHVGCRATNPVLRRQRELLAQRIAKVDA